FTQKRSSVPSSAPTSQPSTKGRPKTSTRASRIPMPMPMKDKPTTHQRTMVRWQISCNSENLCSVPRFINRCRLFYDFRARCLQHSFGMHVHNYKLTQLSHQRRASECVEQKAP